MKTRTSPFSYEIVKMEHINSQFSSAAEAITLFVEGKKRKVERQARQLQKITVFLFTLIVTKELAKVLIRTIEV